MDAEFFKRNIHAAVETILVESLAAVDIADMQICMCLVAWEILKNSEEFRLHQLGLQKLGALDSVRAIYGIPYEILAFVHRFRIVDGKYIPWPLFSIHGQTPDRAYQYRVEIPMPE